ncbi:hypothetical protein [Variovorax rhizosphaerae]|uniref:Nucleotidyltransferase n=1 Tax=Variovorax rhizosphaerae TaxID=1836200 RepID=A0ABU8X0I3_9BURK
MEFTAPTGLRRSRFGNLRQGIDSRRALLRPQIDRLMERLEGVGVKSEVIGSLARESAPFTEGSKVDVLILDDAGLRGFRLLEIAWDEVRDAPVDLVFARDLTEAQLTAVRRHA